MKATIRIAIWLTAMIGLTVTAFAQGQPTTASATSTATTKKAVQEAQQRLQVLGYKPGSADGVMGSSTIVALKKFQSDRGLPVTGMLDHKTLEALRGKSLSRPVPVPADDNKEVPNLAQSASITARDSWVAKTPGIISREDSYRIRTLEFDHEQSVEDCTFSSIAMVFVSDNLATINFGGDLRQSLWMKKGGIKLSCNGQVLVKQGENEVPILLYAPDDENPFPRFVGAKINDESAVSGWITIVDSQQKQLKLPLLKFRVGETLVRCVIADKSAMDNPSNKGVSKRKY